MLKDDGRVMCMTRMISETKSKNKIKMILFVEKSKRKARGKKYQDQIVRPKN
jgi:hypothetical protein